MSEIIELDFTKKEQKDCRNCLRHGEMHIGFANGKPLNRFHCLRENRVIGEGFEMPSYKTDCKHWVYNHLSEKDKK